MSDFAAEDVRLALLAALRPLLERAGTSVDEVDARFDMFGSGVVDSLELVDLFAKIEESLGAQLSFEDLDFDKLTDIGSSVGEITRILR